MIRYPVVTTRAIIPISFFIFSVRIKVQELLSLMVTNRSKQIINATVNVVFIDIK